MSTSDKSRDTIALEEIGEIHGGSTPARSCAQFWGGDIPWVTPAEITKLPTKWLESTRESITESGLASCGTRILPPRSLLVTTRATLGYVAMNRSSVCTNQGFKNIVVNQYHEPDFYYHLIEHFGPEMERLATGSTFLELSSRDFRALRLPSFCLDEQRRIALILDTADAAIAKTEALIAKLKQMKAGLLHDLLTRGIDENGGLRPASAVVSKEGFPASWDVSPINKLCEYLSYGFTCPMPTTESGPFMITAVDVVNGSINYSTARHTSQSAFESLTQKSRPIIGDILITKDGTLGRVAFVDRSDICINQSVACIRPLSDTHADFLALYLKSNHGQQQMLADAGGSTIKHIYISKLAEMPVPVPGVDEADEICKRMIAHESWIGREMQTLEKLRKLKAGLMNDLLTGKKPVFAEAAAAS
ncbi:restriction endonuclease subunit S [Novipirellula rosea]|uniref:Restriction endonuclease subunit S n=1 Tax=Novipirellula rosea TaxID=1031540 RepID=A0ABP8NHB6_9BACT